jgi:hypothetical protein
MDILKKVRARSGHWCGAAIETARNRGGRGRGCVRSEWGAYEHAGGLRVFKVTDRSATSRGEGLIFERRAYGPFKGGSKIKYITMPRCGSQEWSVSGCSMGNPWREFATFQGCNRIGLRRLVAIRGGAVFWLRMQVVDR